MKLGKINILVLSLLMMYGEIYQNTSYRFDEYNRTNAIGEKYIEIRRRNLKIVIRKRKWFSRF